MRIDQSRIIRDFPIAGFLHCLEHWLSLCRQVSKIIHEAPPVTVWAPCLKSRRRAWHDTYSCSAWRVKVTSNLRSVIPSDDFVVNIRPPVHQSISSFLDLWLTLISYASTIHRKWFQRHRRFVDISFAARLSGKHRRPISGCIKNV